MFMGGRKKLLVLLLVGVAVLVLALFALFYLPPLIAMFVGGVALVILLSMAMGRRRHHRDALSRLQADAAQRGNQSAFLGDRNDHIRW